MLKIGTFSTRQTITQGFDGRPIIIQVKVSSDKPIKRFKNNKLCVRFGTEASIFKNTVNFMSKEQLNAWEGKF